MFSIAILGGIFLNIGAFFTMKGKIYHSVVVYLIADICWIFLALEKADYIGSALITIGTALGAIAFYKMQKGKMNKNL